MSKVVEYKRSKRSICTLWYESLSEMFTNLRQMHINVICVERPMSCTVPTKLRIRYMRPSQSSKAGYSLMFINTSIKMSWIFFQTTDIDVLQSYVDSYASELRMTKTHETSWCTYPDSEEVHSYSGNPHQHPVRLCNEDGTFGFSVTGSYKFGISSLEGRGEGIRTLVESASEHFESRRVEEEGEEEEMSENQDIQMPNPTNVSYGGLTLSPYAIAEASHNSSVLDSVIIQIRRCYLEMFRVRPSCLRNIEEVEVAEEEYLMLVTKEERNRILINRRMI